MISTAQLKYKNGNGWGGFKLKSINGSLFLNGDYRIENSHLLRNYKDENKLFLVGADLNINTQSILLHKNFLLIDLGGAYSPGLKRENYVIAPDRSENMTSEKLNLGLNFFNQRPLTFNIYGNYAHKFINRDLTSDIESKQFKYGTNVSFTNEYLPVSVKYLHDNWQQSELQNSRKFKTVRENIAAEFNKSFSKFDETEVKIYYDDISRKYVNSQKINSYRSSFTLHNRVYLTSDHYNSMNSYLMYQDQNGNQILNRLQFSENLMLRPIEAIGVQARYLFNKNNFLSVKSEQNSIFGEVTHHLFQSLDSYVNYEFISHEQSFFDEKVNRGAAGFRYNKLIPTGTLNIAYEFNWRSEDKTSESSRQLIINELVEIRDGQLVLIENPNVIISSIVVKDLTSTIIYQEVLDYLIIERGDFVEILRVPGGQISNGQTVMIDYQFDFRSDYNVEAAGNRISTNVSFLNNLLNVYFRYNDLSFTSVEGIGFNTLKYFTQKIYGIKTQYLLINAGVEFEEYSSNITPYRSKRYYIDLNDTFFQRLLLYLSTGYRSFELTDKNENQIFKDAAARLTYLFDPFTKLNVIINGRAQQGRGLDLDWSSIRAEFTTNFRKIILVLGYENVYRNFSGDRINYNNIYVRIGRNF